MKTRKKGGKNRRISFDTWKRSKKFNFDERFREKVVVSFCPTMNDLLPLDEWNGWREGAGYSQSIIL